MCITTRTKPLLVCLAKWSAVVPSGLTNDIPSARAAPSLILPFLRLGLNLHIVSARRIILRAQAPSRETFTSYLNDCLTNN